MKIYRPFLRLTIGNFICCLGLFLILGYWQANDQDAVAINLGLGWIFWLGIFAIISPLFLSDTSKEKMFSKEYFGGSIILAIANVAIPIFCATLSSMIVVNE